jgi:hypothetical protein
MEMIVVGKEIAVKKYVLRFSAEDRSQLHELILKASVPPSC